MFRKSIYILLFSTILPVMVHASAYWLEIKGVGKIDQKVVVELIYGNIDDLGIRHRQKGTELQLAGDFKFSIVDPKGEKLPVKMTLQADCWSFSFTPKLKGIYRIIGMNDSHPVVDRSKSGGENILPIDYLIGQYQVGTENTDLKPLQFLDIITSKENKLIRIKAFNNGSPSKAGVKLRVFNPQNWEKELVLNEKGEALFMPTLIGMYVVRQDWTEKKSGSYHQCALYKYQIQVQLLSFLSLKAKN